MIYQPELSKLLLWIQLATAIIAILFFNKVKGTYWKWFSIYLVFIFIQEFFIEDVVTFFGVDKDIYFAYFGIPIQFLFLYWLYAYKSLNNLKLTTLCIIIYALSFLPINSYFDTAKIVYSFNYTVGTLILVFLIFLEFFKQIKEDKILQFRYNKMFYINIGAMLFYVGTLPFFGLYRLIVEIPDIWNNYYIYFLVSNCIMYLLFIASIIWGKEKF